MSSALSYLFSFSFWLPSISPLPPPISPPATVYVPSKSPPASLWLPSTSLLLPFYLLTPSFSIPCSHLSCDLEIAFSMTSPLVLQNYGHNFVWGLYVVTHMDRHAWMGSTLLGILTRSTSADIHLHFMASVDTIVCVCFPWPMAQEFSSNQWASSVLRALGIPTTQCREW